MTAVFALCQRLSFAALLMCVSACGSNSPGWWETPSTSPASPSPTPTAITVVNIVFDPPALNGGGTTQGKVTVSLPAPPGGMPVTLSTSDAAVRVPPAVTVPGGERSAVFPVTTQAVPRDVDVDVIGAVGGVTGRATLNVWALLSTSFSWISEPADTIYRGRYGRLTPDNTSFVARCERDELMVQMDSRVSSTSSVDLGAPRGVPLRPGTYEGATRTAFRRGGEPGIDVSIEGTGCNTTRGRFVVTEADFAANGEVRRFAATFEQYCGNSTSAVRGELRLTGPFRMPPFTVTCLR